MAINIDTRPSKAMFKTHSKFPPTACGYCDGRIPVRRCGSRSNRGFRCTRQWDHEPPHVYCAENEHRKTSW